MILAPFSSSIKQTQAETQLSRKSPYSSVITAESKYKSALAFKSGGGLLKNNPNSWMLRPIRFGIPSANLFQKNGRFFIAECSIASLSWYAKAPC